MQGEITVARDCQERVSLSESMARILGQGRYQLNFLADMRAKLRYSLAFRAEQRNGCSTQRSRVVGGSYTHGFFFQHLP